MTAIHNQPIPPSQTDGLAATPRPSVHVPALDGLRALAALAVFGVHLEQITSVSGHLGPFELGRLLENGNTGVCLFFVLSGFLLSLPFWLRGGLPTTGDGAPGGRRRWMIGYALRRVGRIVPAYFLCLTVLVLWEECWTSSKGIISAGLHYLFVHNLAEFSLYDFSPPFWTLAVQAQFYVVFPLLMLLLAPLLRRTGVAVAAMMFLAGIGYGVHVFVAETLGRLATCGAIPAAIIAPDGLVLEHTLLAHLPHFLLGTAAAGLYVRSGEGVDRKTANDALCFLAAVTLLVVLSVPALDECLTVPHGRYNLPYVPLLLAAIVLAAPKSRMVLAGLSFTPLAWLGMISYGVYVYHLPVMTLTGRLMEAAGLSPTALWPLFALVSFAASLLVAATSHYFIEQPVLRWFGRRAMGGDLPRSGEFKLNVQQLASGRWLRWSELGPRDRFALGAQAALAMAIGVWLLVSVIAFDPRAGDANSDAIFQRWEFPITAVVIWEGSLVLAALASLRPMLGVWSYLLVAYAVPRYSPENSFAMSFGLAEWCALLAMTGWAGWLYRRSEPFQWPRHWLTAVLVALVGWGTVSLAVSAFRDGLIPFVPWHHPIQYVEGLLLFLLVATFFDGRRDALWLGAAVLAIVTIHGRIYSDYNYLNNDLGAWIAIGCPLAALAVAATRKWWIRLALSALVLHFFWLLYATRNRGGAVALVAAIGLGWLLAHSRVKWLLMLVAVPVLLVGGQWMANKSDFGKRFRDIFTGGTERASVDSRLEIWRGGRLMAAEHPLFGVGPSRFHEHLGDYSDLKNEQPHNNFLAMAAEFGLPGLALYGVFFLGALTLSCWIGWQNNDLWPGLTCQMTAAALLAYPVIGLFLTRQDMVFAYVLAGVPVAAWRTLRGRPTTPVTSDEKELIDIRD